MKISKQNGLKVYLLIVSIIILNQSGALAVSDYGNTSAQEYGDAVYRYLDAWGLGILANYNHAGLFAGIDGSDSLRVLHAADYYPCVQDADFDIQFKNNPPYYGAYTHSSFTSMNFSERKVIVKTARDLSAATIYYTLWNAIDPFTSARPITISNIDNLRCDGVVEYCYEAHSYWIWEPANDRGKWSILYNPEAHNDMPDLSMNPDTELSPWSQRGAPANTGPWYFGSTNPNNSYLTQSALIDLPTYEVSSWADGDHMVVQVKAKDIKSGIHKIGYRLPGGSGWTYSRNVQHPSSDTYTQQYNVYTEGDFYYWAQDSGGNQPEYAEGVVVQFSTWYRDADGDGYGNPNNSKKYPSQPSGYVSDNSDCDDNYSSVHPGATEICDGKDNDCDGQVDEGIGQTWYRDADGDGYGNPNNSKQACSQPSGYVSNNTDCSDSDASAHPGATEICDGKDNDCDGQVDEGIGPTWYRDADGDGYGNPNNSTQACSQPSGYVSNNTDCSDSDVSVHPGATEICDGKDNDCDGQIDEGVKLTWYRDADGDGYGNPNNSTQACSQPSGYVSNNTDCSDSDASVYPGATEICDGKDNDCDGQIDEGAKPTWYRDADGDGYGNPNNSTQSCSQPSGYVSNNTDCSDSDATVHPGATEICDGKDNDCDGQIDEGVKPTWYRDADGDGYGNPNNSTQACSQPSGYVSNNTDCSDSDASVHPGATEVCDGKDNDCDGQVDEGIGPTWYRDADGDGYGNPNNSTQACSQPSGYISNNTDCSDSDASVHPGATEVFDGKDNDCDGQIDESGALQVFLNPPSAMWSVDDGEWQNSGNTITGLSPTLHTLNYSLEAGWTAPLNEQITIDEGQTTIINRDYGPPCIFGSFNGQKNVKLVLKDCNNNDVTFNLTGGGYGEIDCQDCAFSNITLHGTTEKSILSIKTKGNIGTSVGDIICQGPLGCISAKTIDISGNIEIGTLGKPGALAITFDDVSNLTIDSQMPIKTFTATEWNGGSINAPSIGSISIKGDKKRRIPGDLNIDIITSGNISTVKVAGEILGEWNCNAVKSIKALNLDTFNLNLRQGPDAVGKILALGTLNIKGSISGSNIQSAGHIGKVSVGEMADSNCFAGVAEGINGLPPASADSFENKSTIKSIAVKGIKTYLPPYYINSNIAATNILNASIVYPQSDNNGVPFGLCADYIKKLTIKHIVGTATKLKELQESKDSQTIDGVEIRLY